jgi:hypothetical protein
MEVVAIVVVQAVIRRHQIDNLRETSLVSVDKWDGDTLDKVEAVALLDWIKVKNSRYSQLEGREELFERSRPVTVARQRTDHVAAEFDTDGAK